MKKHLLLIVASFFIATNLLCQTANFEDFPLEPESHYMGDESLTGFTSGDFFFGNDYNAAWMSFAGFAVSNHTSIIFDAGNFVDDQFNSIVGSGYDGSANFAVVFVYGEAPTVTMTNETPKQISGVYVTNSAYVHSSLINGDYYMGDPFTHGDWFTIIAVGKDADEKTSRAEFYLADFRSDNSEEHFIVDEWQWFDLSVLGEVVSITFELAGSRVGEYGLNIPNYFCMDNFNGSAPSAVDNHKYYDVVVYPNPTTNYINVRVDDKLVGNNGNVKLYDFNGILLDEFKLNSLMNIDMTRYSNGIYFVVIQNSTLNVVRKIVKI